MAHKQLTRDQRYHIYGLYKAGYSDTEIALEVGVHKSTIGREIRRNSRWNGYYPEQAQFFSDDRRRNAYKRVKFTQDVKAFVQEKLLLDWSPDQISGYAKRLKMFEISHERIYQFILKDKKVGGELYLHLRHQHKKYRKRYGSPKRNGPIKNRKLIDERPNIVDEKKRIGDWEIDTIICGECKQAVVTIVERVSKKTVLKKVESKTAELVSNATIKGLKKFSGSVFTITGDNGSEFAYHEKISKELNADFYFAHPYSSWERGLNENTNGLVRQYLKKGISFKNVTDDDLATITEKLNNRPRKKLGYATPDEAFTQNTFPSELF